MKRKQQIIILMAIVLVLYFVAIALGVAFGGHANSATCAGNPNGVCEFNPHGALVKDPTPPNPNRPYFDAWGNQFTYNGKLIDTGQCPYTDPINGQPNPYCPPTTEQMK